MATTENRVTGSRPISATRTDEIGVYGARFAPARNRLVRICADFVGADAAEDIVHDTYLRGRDRFKQLRDDDLFESWLTPAAMANLVDA